jgi:SAM-dependent methyltransferase
MSCCTPKAPATSPAVESNDIRDRVRERYADVARTAGVTSCCGGEQSCSTVESSQAVGYSPDELASIPGEANLGVGCGNPTAVAEIRKGETVVDLGSGGGIDCFLAAKATGPDGHVIGIDMTEEMLERARRAAREGGFTNVEFRKGFIEELPLDDAAADLVISNCVINLSPDKPQVLREAFRVLKSGGRVAVSDVVMLKPLTPELAALKELYSGCVGGAATVDELRTWLTEAGFADIRIEPKPESRELIAEWAPGLGVENYVASATIQARKP